MTHRVSAGPDLAVAIGVAADPTADVLAFIKEDDLPIDRLLVLSPPVGIRDNAIADAAAAVAFAHGARDHICSACQRASRVHLNLADPAGLALLLGHRWNRMRPPVIYEDVQGQARYEQAFTVEA